MTRQLASRDFPHVTYFQFPAIGKILLIGLAFFFVEIICEKTGPPATEAFPDHTAPGKEFVKAWFMRDVFWPDYLGGLCEPLFDRLGYPCIAGNISGPKATRVINSLERAYRKTQVDAI